MKSPLKNNSRDSSRNTGKHCPFTFIIWVQLPFSFLSFLIMYFHMWNSSRDSTALKKSVFTSRTTIFFFNKTLLDFENALKLEKSKSTWHSLLGYLEPVEMMQQSAQTIAYRNLAPCNCLCVWFRYPTDVFRPTRVHFKSRLEF